MPQDHETEKWVKHLIHLMDRMESEMREGRKENAREIAGLRRDIGTLSEGLTKVRESIASIHAKASILGLVAGFAPNLVHKLIGK